MFYNAKPHIFEKAKLLRNRMTDSEQKLWKFLKGKKVLSLRFRTQHPIDIFIADFYCHALKLVIEVDGGIHESKDHQEEQSLTPDQFKSQMHLRLKKTI